MKVTLVNPFRGESEYVTPPIGLAYLASSLRKKSIEVKIIDAQALRLRPKKLSKMIKQSSPNFVGFTAFTPTFNAAIEEAKLVNDLGIKTILGGPHATLEREKILKDHDEFDYSFVGEAEETLPKFLLSGPEKVEGIVYRNGKNRVKYTGGAGRIEDLDSLSFPAHNLINLRNYFHPLVNRKPFTTMITSRGCPYNCLYCCKAVTGYKFRSRSPSNVIGEIELLIEDFNIKEIIFHDDIFTLDMKRVEKICDLIHKNKFDITWKCETRVDRINYNLLKKMKGAGCELMSYGVESGSQEVLNTLRKGIKLEQIKRAFELTKKVGIDILAYFIIGSPGENFKTIKKTIDFAIELDPEFVQFSFATPFPGTGLFDFAIERGVIDESDYSSLLFFGKDAKPTPLSELNVEELQRAMKFAYKKFYLRPNYAFKMLKKTKTLTQFQERFHGLKSLLSY